LKISYIEDKDAYRQQIESFKKNVEEFYRCGSQSFLKNNHETFFCHVLRFYLPSTAENTFLQHGLSLGIFSIQGFERRNKESKNTAKQFLTKNVNSPAILVNNL